MIKIAHKGITMLEMVVVLGMLLLLITVVAVNVHPEESKQKARDTKRVSDLSTLERAIYEYNAAHSSYPGTLNVLKISTTLPSDSSEPQNATSGWMGVDLSSYITKMPTDPLNDATYFYSYTHSATSFELNCQLEYFSEMMTSDGGNDPLRYEVGNSLSLISP